MPAYQLKAVVFRMSCIYGPHQFGTEDQGWVAHFLIQAIKGRTIHIYGDGKQVRDILYVEDLLKAFTLAWKNMDEISGKVFNIGGGVGNAISLLELLNLIEIKHKLKIDLAFGPARTGDQVYYVSDTLNFRQAVGWAPAVPIEEGLEKIFNWLCTQHRSAPNQEQLNDHLVHEYIARTAGNGTKTT